MYLRFVFDYFCRIAMNCTNIENAATQFSRTFLILPVFNQARILPGMFQKLAELPSFPGGFEIIVVDDGSTDATAQIAMAGRPDLSVQLVQHFRSCGSGRAIQTGIQQACRRAGADDVIIVMEADECQDFTMMKWMSDEVVAGSDVVIASRFVEIGEKKGLSPDRNLQARCASLASRLLFGEGRVKDCTGTYRAYRASLLRKAWCHWGDHLIEARGFASAVEILLKLRRWDPVIREIPLTLPLGRRKGPKKRVLFQAIFHYAKLRIRDWVTPQQCETPVRIYCAKTDTIEIQPSFEDVALQV